MLLREIGFLCPAFGLERNYENGDFDFAKGQGGCGWVTIISRDDC